MAAKTSFLLYHSYYEVIKHLPDADFAAIHRAMYEYQINKIILPLASHLQLAFSFIRSQLDRDNEKYQTIVDRNRANGIKGGRPQNNPDEPKEPSGFSGNPNNPNNPSEPRKADTDTVADTVADTGNVKKKGSYAIAYSGEFENFLAVYPKNDGRKARAYEKYNQAIKGGITHDTIIRGARAFEAISRAKGTERRYIPHAASWLHQRGWETEHAIDAVKPNGSAKPGKGKQALDAANEALAELGIPAIG